jgi:hypothetical protein
VKFVCLGYIAPGKFENMPKDERDGMLDECFDYDDQLRADGHYAVGEALQSLNSAKSVRLKNGKVIVTDGPYAETKEQIGGILLLEARDLDHAVQLVSRHPGLKFGPWEIRPAGDLNAIVEESRRRRGKHG